MIIFLVSGRMIRLTEAEQSTLIDVLNSMTSRAASKFIGLDDLVVNADEIEYIASDRRHD